MNKNFSDGVWPVMLTPFTSENQVDYDSLASLVEWYIQKGVAGLFAVCQSSEMFNLSLDERVEITKYVKEQAAGRIKVIASGHIADSIQEQIRELNAVREAGADAVIMLTNRLAAEDEDDAVWLKNLKTILENIPEDTALGFYECPYPYKRIITPELLKYCAETGRFHFLKDTSCDIENMKAKMAVIKGTPLKLFNANTSTLLETLEYGVHGFSGVMANFHPELYVWLVENFRKYPGESRALNDFLTVASFIERQVYPVNAKYFLQKKGIINTIVTRVKNESELTKVACSEVEQLARLTCLFSDHLQERLQ